MKKILCVLSVLLFVNLPVLAQVLEPQWSEFCPDKYLNAEYKKSTLWDYWFSFSREPKNYWANRRSEFNANITTCKSARSDQELLNCYEQARQIEQNKNNVYLVQQGIKLEKDRQWMNMYNTTQQNLQTQQIINGMNQPKYYNVNVRQN